MIQDIPPFIQELKLAFDQALPGRAGHLKMAPFSRKFVDAPDNARQSSTLLLLFKKEGEWCFPLIQRVGSEHDKHSGQISFPGGSFEANDRSFEFTALRETEEEIGINKGDVEIIGKLSQTYIPVSNFNIHPYVGFIPSLPQFTIEHAEVAEVFEFPLHLLNDLSIRKVRDIKVRQMLLRDIPYFEFQEKVIWGATAMMLSEFADILQKTKL
ncbi:MAG: CoA pyrophosphatase [Bacteroidota bacterium]